MNILICTANKKLRGFFEQYFTAVLPDVSVNTVWYEDPSIDSYILDVMRGNTDTDIILFQVYRFHNEQTLVNDGLETALSILKSFRNEPEKMKFRIGLFYSLSKVGYDPEFFFIRSLKDLLNHETVRSFIDDIYNRRIEYSEELKQRLLKRFPSFGKLGHR